MEQRFVQMLHKEDIQMANKHMTRYPPPLQVSEERYQYHKKMSVCTHSSIRCSAVSNSLQSYGLSLPGSSIHGVLQARILEWVVIPFGKT